MKKCTQGTWNDYSGKCELVLTRHLAWPGWQRLGCCLPHTSTLLANGLAFREHGVVRTLRKGHFPLAKFCRICLCNWIRAAGGKCHLSGTLGCMRLHLSGQ